MPTLLSLRDREEGGLRPDMLPLGDFLLPVTHPAVAQEIKDFAFELEESGLRSGFRDPMLPPVDDIRRQPHCAWVCGSGGFGQRAYVRAVPAIKVFGEGL